MQTNFSQNINFLPTNRGYDIAFQQHKSNQSKNHQCGILFLHGHGSDMFGGKAETIMDWVSSNLESNLTEAGIPCGCVRNYKEALNNPHSIERQLVKEISDGQGSKIKTIRNPVLINKKPIRIDNLAPELGQHSFEILNEVGIDKNAFSKLVSDGITI